MLTDDTDLKPTKKNILDMINKFVNRANNENIKELWFSYSGHGSYTWNFGGDKESDSKDEALVPVDYETAGLITDDMLNNNLVKKLPKDGKLFLVIDACHSGTSLVYLIYRVDTGFEEHGADLDCLDVCKISGCRDNQTMLTIYK